MRPTDSGGMLARDAGTATMDSTVGSVDAARDACVPREESCNEVDDDCDGRVDETPASGRSCARPNALTACVEGLCILEGCTSGWDDCNRNASDGCETGLTELSSCGGCGVPCILPNATPTCATTTCRVAWCEDGFADCDGDPSNGCERPLRTLTDCSGCGVTCDLPDAAESCASGACGVTSCAHGRGDCDGVAANGCETDLTSSANCGACGVACSFPNAGVFCASGGCALGACDPGFGDCDGDIANGCESSLASPTSCGACGVACAPGQTCLSGSCVDPGPQLALGQHHSCVVRMGAVYCWGLNDYGQTGQGGSFGGFYDARDVGPVVGLSDAVSVGAGGGTSCAVRSSGASVCWGYNGHGQLGNGRTGALTSTSSPTAVLGVTDAVAVTSNGGTTCWLDRAGTVSCSGQNGTSGSLGSGDYGLASASIPRSVTGVFDAVDLNVTCVTRRTGIVRCWGPAGALGQGAHWATGSSQSFTAATMVDLDDAIDVSLGGWEHACATRRGGTVQCWGRNQYGELGHGGLVSSVSRETRPATVVGVSDAVMTAAGLTFSCALSATGQVLCWGRNQLGQLGNGTRTDSNVPVPVTGLSDAVEIGAGSHHACATRATGAVVCWGFDGMGQLGRGLPSRLCRDLDAMCADSTTPVTVHRLP